VPVRNGSIGWRHRMTHYKDQILAYDFFTIETLRLQTIYVLFFIELRTRQIHFAGCTEKPDTIWITQQARELIWDLDDSSHTFRFLIHDHDTKFSSLFDNVFISDEHKTLPKFMIIEQLILKQGSPSSIQSIKETKRSNTPKYGHFGVLDLDFSESARGRTENLTLKRRLLCH
jgi:hypothetical protein